MRKQPIRRRGNILTVYCPKCGRFLFETELPEFVAWCPCGGTITYPES